MQPAVFSSQPDTEPAVNEAVALAKVRDLLFGNQARDIDKRLQELDRRLTETLDQIHRQTYARIDQLARDLQMRLDRLEGQTENLNLSFTTEKEHTGSRFETLRTELIGRLQGEAEALGERLTESRKETFAHIEQATEDLDAAKTDRDALAALLLEMAARVKER